MVLRTEDDTVGGLLALDDPAFTVRELLRYYKKEIVEGYRNVENLSPRGGQLHHMRYVFAFTREEIQQFLVEEAMENTCIGYKLFRKRKDGSYGPLFINRKLRMCAVNLWRRTFAKVGIVCGARYLSRYSTPSTVRQPKVACGFWVAA